jgi:hypothetical protein
MPAGVDACAKPEASDNAAIRPATERLADMARAGLEPLADLPKEKEDLKKLRLAIV